MPGFCKVLLATVEESQFGVLGLGGSKTLPKLTPAMSKIQASPRALVWFVRSVAQGRASSSAPKPENSRPESDWACSKSRYSGQSRRACVPTKTISDGSVTMFELPSPIRPLAEADRVARPVPDVAHRRRSANLADVRKRPVGRTGRLAAGELEARADAGKIVVASRLDSSATAETRSREASWAVIRRADERVQPRDADRRVGVRPVAIAWRSRVVDHGDDQLRAL